MGPIPSFSLPPGLACNPDAPCWASGCYARRLCRFRPKAADSWKRNLSIVDKDSECDTFERQIMGWLSIYQPVAFRIHVAGDFHRVEYLSSWVRIAKANPRVKFFAFTKQWDVIREYLGSMKIGRHGEDVLIQRRKFPSNLSLILSSWFGFIPPADLRKRFPVAWLVKDIADVEKDVRPICGGRNIIQCEGHCSTCGRCFNLKRKDGDVLFTFHK